MTDTATKPEALGETRARDDYDVVSRLLQQRHSCRAFAPKAVPVSTIEAMLTAAQRTATWCNVQPWQVIVTTGDGTERFRSALRSAATTEAMNTDIPLPAEYHGIYQQRRRDSGLALYESLGIGRDDQDGRLAQSLANFELFGAPHVLLIHSDAKLGAYGYVDCGAYIANLLLAAEALGIAAVPQGAVAMQSRLIHEHFALPADRLVVAAVSFGYEKQHPANDFRTTRAELPDVATWIDA